MSQGSEDYEDFTIRVPELPVAERVGEWWRRRWHFEVPEASETTFRLPPPLGEIRELSMLVSSWWESNSILIVETITGEEELSVDEMTYMSLVGAWLKV